MLKVNLEKKLVKKDDDDNSTIYCCEICGTKPAAKKAAAVTNIKEFYKDGTTKIHYTCSNHIVDLYNKIEIENKERRTRKVS